MASQKDSLEALEDLKKATAKLQDENARLLLGKDVTESVAQLAWKVKELREEITRLRKENEELSNRLSALLGGRTEH